MERFTVGAIVNRYGFLGPIIDAEYYYFSFLIRQDRNY
jgi:hypothetical protein